MSRVVCERSWFGAPSFSHVTRVPFYAVSQVPVGVPFFSIDLHSPAALRSLCDTRAYRSLMTTVACRSNLLAATTC